MPRFGGSSKNSCISMWTGREPRAVVRGPREENGVSMHDIIGGRYCLNFRRVGFQTPSACPLQPAPPNRHRNQSLPSAIAHVSCCHASRSILICMRKGACSRRGLATGWLSVHEPLSLHNLYLNASLFPLPVGVLHAKKLQCVSANNLCIQTSKAAHGTSEAHEKASRRGQAYRAAAKLSAAVALRP